MLINAKEATKALNVKEDHLYKMIANGNLISEKIDGRIFVNKEEVLRKRPTVLVFFNQKGGVSKTSSAICAADYYEKKGLKVLCIDLDPQSNLTQTYLSNEQVSSGKTLYDFLENSSVKIPGVTYKISEYLDIIPSSIKLSKKDTLDSSETIKYKFDDFYPAFKKYEIVIIDCPPTLGALSRMGVLLSNYVLLPLDYTPFCYNGLGDALDTIKTMKRINPDFIDIISFGSKHSKRREISKVGYREDYINDLGEKFLTQSLPEFVGIAERPNLQDNIFNYGDHNPAKSTKEKLEQINDLFNAINTRIFEGRKI